MAQSDTKVPLTDIENKLVAELQKLDLTSNEAKILVHLMARGRSSASDISRHTGIQRTETYNYISGLLARGIIFSTFDRPQKYHSMPLEEVVEYLLQSKRNALEVFEGKKKEYAAMFDALVSHNVVTQEDKQHYNVIIGENAMNSKISRMLADAKEEVSVLIADKNLISFYHAGITDQLIGLTTKGVYVHLRTACKNAENYIASSKQVSCSTTSKTVPASFVLVDGKEIVVILEGQVVRKSELCAFYTNNISLVSVFKFLFENVV